MSAPDDHRVTVTIQQTSRHGWQGVITFGPATDYVYAVTRKSCEARARRRVERAAQERAWRDSAVTQIIGPWSPSTTPRSTNL